MKPEDLGLGIENVVGDVSLLKRAFEELPNGSVSLKEVSSLEAFSNMGSIYVYPKEGKFGGLHVQKNVILGEWDVVDFPGDKIVLMGRGYYFAFHYNPKEEDEDGR